MHKAIRAKAFRPPTMNKTIPENLLEIFKDIKSSRHATMSSWHMTSLPGMYMCPFLVKLSKIGGKTSGPTMPGIVFREVKTPIREACISFRKISNRVVSNNIHKHNFLMRLCRKCICTRGLAHKTTTLWLCRKNKVRTRCILDNSNNDWHSQFCLGHTPHIKWLAVKALKKLIIYNELFLTIYNDFYNNVVLTCHSGEISDHDGGVQ